MQFFYFNKQLHLYVQLITLFRTIRFTFCMHLYTLNFQLGSKDGNLTSWQLYQTSSRAYYAKSVSNLILKNETTCRI